MYIGLLAKYTLFLSDFNENEFSQQIFEKYSNFNFHKNSFIGSRVVPPRADGRTDGKAERHDEVKSRFSQFCEKRLLNVNCPDTGSINCIRPVCNICKNI